MTQWTVLQFLQAGAYIAIMLAVLGVPQLLSSFFDIRERRKERQEAERRREEAERRREETERRREEDARQREEEARRREDRHHEEFMTLLATIVSNTSGRNGDKDDVIRAQQQIIDRLATENDRLRQENGNGSQ